MAAATYGANFLFCLSHPAGMFDAPERKVYAVEQADESLEMERDEWRERALAAEATLAAVEAMVTASLRCAGQSSAPPSLPTPLSAPCADVA